MRLMGSFHTMTTHGSCGSATSSESGRSMVSGLDGAADVMLTAYLHGTNAQEPGRTKRRAENRRGRRGRPAFTECRFDVMGVVVGPSGVDVTRLEAAF